MSVVPESRPAVERFHPPRALMKVVNPVMRRLLERGLGGRSLIVLHYTGRRSGKSYDLPVGFHVIDGDTYVITNAGWRHNFAGGVDIEVTRDGRRQPVRATLLEDPDEVVAFYARRISEMGPKSAGRRMGLRINVDREPTRAELRDAVDRYGLSLIKLDFATA